MRIFETKLTVYSTELDSFGHVNNSVYLKYLEMARCDYMRQVGLSFNSFKENNAFPAVKDADIHYHKSLVCDDVFTVRGYFCDWSHASFFFNYDILKEDGTLVLTARLKFAMIDFDGKIIRVPDFFKNAFYSE